LGHKVCPLALCAAGRSTSCLKAAGKVEAVKKKSFFVLFFINK
jgi:hypothetical protein